MSIKTSPYTVTTVGSNLVLTFSVDSSTISYGIGSTAYNSNPGTNYFNIVNASGTGATTLDYSLCTSPSGLSKTALITAINALVPTTLITPLTSDLLPNTTNSINIGNATKSFASVVSNGIQAVDSVMYFNSGPNIRKITVTSPLPDDTMTTNTSTQTLTNKTLTAPVMSSIVNGGGTLTVPSGLTDTFLTGTNAIVVSNKQLDTTNNFVDQSDNTKIVHFNISGQTTGVTSSLVFTSSRIGQTFTFPNATSNDTVVLQAFAQTLTNKTLTSPVLSWGTSTFTTNWTGIWAAPQAANCTYATDGFNVWMRFPALSVTETTAATVTNVTSLPVAIRPTANRDIPFLIQDNAFHSSTMSINTAGLMTIWAAGNTGNLYQNFTGATGTPLGGWPAQEIHYTLF